MTTEYEVLMQRDNSPIALPHHPPLGEGVKMTDLESVFQWARKRSAQLGTQYRLSVYSMGETVPVMIFRNGEAAAAEEAANNAR